MDLWSDPVWPFLCSLVNYFRDLEKFEFFDFLLNSGIPSFIGRHLISSVKQGRGYFHTLQKETLERKNALKSEDLDEELTDLIHCCRINPFSYKYSTCLFFLHFHSEPLFRQLCALHWLLEALTLEPNCSLKPVLTCWNPKDPGGSKSTFKKINKDKAARYRWEHFIMDTKHCFTEMNHPWCLCAFTCSSHASYFIQSKYNLCAEMRQKFSAVAEEAAFCAQQCKHQFQGRLFQLCSAGYYRFSSLLSRIPDTVKNDNHTQRILKKLEKFGKNPDMRIRPITFLKVLSELRVWELCSPDICAAVEFVRENIVQMPEEDYKAWLQTRVRIPRRAHSAPPLC
uniref:Coiled-coil domain containing 60 n=1 Tax=Chelydra serpentina TaxID=8475 RepID=A0A8C3XVB1_CHESE